MGRSFSLILTALLLSFLLVGCSNEKPASKEVSGSLENEQEVNDYLDEIDNKGTEQQGIKYKNNYPLTGLGTNSEVDQRVFTVMINNHPKARPQTGLNEADIVYEILAEGFVTRFLAVYQSEYPEVVGPIRSARDYYINLSRGFDSIYVAYGGSEEAKKLLDRDVTDYINGIKYINGRDSYEDDPFYYRADFRKAPHNVYITKENLLEVANSHDFSLKDDVQTIPFLSEKELKKQSGEAATEFKITYSNRYNSTVRYLYDKEKEKYQRFNEENQTIDYETKEPLLLDNILVIEAPHKVVDSVGRRDINLKQSGEGYLFQKGTYQKITWENKDGKILPYKNGQAVGFVPGKTWVNVVPTDPGLEEAVSILIEVS